MESQLQLARMGFTYFYIWLVITILACMPRWKRLPNKKPLTILMILLFLAITVLAYGILSASALSLNLIMAFPFFILAIIQALIISKTKKEDKWLTAGIGMAAISMSIVALVAVHLIFR